MLVVTCAVTGEGGMIKETQNTIIIIHQPIQLQRASRDICLVQSAGYYLVQNQIIASRWMHINDIHVKYLVRLDEIVRGLMDYNCVLDFFHDTTHLFN